MKENEMIEKAIKLMDQQKEEEHIKNDIKLNIQMIAASGVKYGTGAMTYQEYDQQTTVYYKEIVENLNKLQIAENEKWEDPWEKPKEK